MKDDYFGIIAEKIDERDYLGEGYELPRSPKGTDSFVKNGEICYDQREVSKVSCTVHAAMTSYSGLTGYEFTLEERKDIWDDALARGANPNVGWYLHDAVHLVYDYVNEREDLPNVEYRRYEVRSDAFGTALRLGYVPVIGYRGNRAYNLDRDDDAIIQSVDVGASTYGHALTARYLKGSMYEGHNLSGIIDNYPPRSTNFYKVPANHWDDLVRNGVMFRHSFIYIIKD